MADDKNGAASLKFELEVKIKPAKDGKDDKPKGGNGVVIVGVIIAILLIFWILMPSLTGAYSPAGTGGYQAPAPTCAPCQVP